MNSRTRKSLLQSYYRQRNIAGEQSERYRFKPYEYNEFVFKNKFVDINRFDSKSISLILSHKPNLIDYFKDRLGELEYLQISYILRYQPELVDYFKNSFNRFDGFDITTTLLVRPNLINYFKDGLGKLNSDQIMAIISKHPQLKPYFENE